MICGFLDTKGVLYPCWKWEHISKAEELVNEFNLGEPQRSELYEDVLLKNGWICIRSVDAYKKVYDDAGKILFITDEQQNFFKERYSEFNEWQLADIDSMLRDFGKLYKWHKENE